MLIKWKATATNRSIGTLLLKNNFLEIIKSSDENVGNKEVNKHVKTIRNTVIKCLQGLLLF